MECDDTFSETLECKTSCVHLLSSCSSTQRGGRSIRIQAHLETSSHSFQWRPLWTSRCLLAGKNGVLFPAEKGFLSFVTRDVGPACLLNTGLHGNSKGKRLLQMYTGVDESIILKWILNGSDVRMWTEFRQFKIRSRGGPLRTRQRTFGFWDFRILKRSCYNVTSSKQFSGLHVCVQDTVIYVTNINRLNSG